MSPRQSQQDNGLTSNQFRAYSTTIPTKIFKRYCNTDIELYQTLYTGCHELKNGHGERRYHAREGSECKDSRQKELLDCKSQMNYDTNNVQKQKVDTFEQHPGTDCYTPPITTPDITHPLLAMNSIHPISSFGLDSHIYHKPTIISYGNKSIPLLYSTLIQHNTKQIIKPTKALQEEALGLLT